MENREPIGGLMSGWGAALAVLLWAFARGLSLRVTASECTGRSCVAQPVSQRGADLTAVSLLALTLVVALLATLGSALDTIVEAGRNRDWLSVAGLLITLALSLIALYALTLNSHLERTFVGALYGSSPVGIDARPVAFGASIALIVLPAVAALAYNLLHERAGWAAS